MKLRELVTEHTESLMLAGYCECGEAVYDLFTDMNLAFPPVHESQILALKPELLDNVGYYNGYGSLIR
ncbi:phenylalanyl-tRNA synthetase subunit beta [Listeria floridensis FSL S10-1187]|uniref:Phenylalanyl-tRNA synthetase subunit beta n=1 Tax=Listeria floridensis FSL S10-1187 TaxID=1265817 RepID=A0ABP3ATR6_9LIST|nr:hypothetical protein [Listeria floridensis]EUJ24239.1 phenylalanyl-tRNA synthetase subunit beta [Listeria floridensis FSL S10-1187]